MEVMINNHPVDFELEGERSLADIVSSIATWTAERDLILSRVHVDEKAYDLEDIPEIDLAGVGHINCIVQSKADLIITTIDEGIRYCERALGFIDSLDDKAEEGSIDDLAAGMEWLAEVLLIVSQQAGLDREEPAQGDESLALHVQRLRELKGALTAGGDHVRAAEELKANRETIVRSREFFGIILMSPEMRSLVMRSIDSPDMVVSQLSAIREGIDSEMANLEAAAVAFQTGKDREGAERLNAFIDFVYGYSRACYQVSPLFGLDLSSVTVEGESLEE
ncbi:MAG: hypothetical protein JXA20_05680, partial [Spirochaetes bacterium]|nr:hypothetical protein [Spirochaetota bacterium]